MADFLNMVGTMVLLFAVSLGFGYLYSRVQRKAVPQLPKIEPNTSCRIVGPGGVYRCYFVGEGKDGLTFSAPLQRDHYVPIRAGEILTIQIAAGDGVLTFRSTVSGRSRDTHEFTVFQPTRFRHHDRRTEGRDIAVRGRQVEVNGNLGELVNISPSGARVVTTDRIASGERIAVRLQHELEPMLGWALESTASSLGKSQARSVRVRFDAPRLTLRKQPS